MKFRPTEFLNTPYRVSCYIKLYRKLFSVMRPIECKVLYQYFTPSLNLKTKSVERQIYG